MGVRTKVRELLSIRKTPPIEQAQRDKDTKTLDRTLPPEFFQCDDLQLRNSLLMESYKGQDRVEALTSINSKLISKYKIQN